jgi:hypothetical protein
VRERSNLASKKQCDLHCRKERSKQTNMKRELGIVPTSKANKTNDPNFVLKRNSQLRSLETFGLGEVHPLEKEIETRCMVYGV